MIQVERGISGDQLKKVPEKEMMEKKQEIKEAEKRRKLHQDLLESK